MRPVNDEEVVRALERVVKQYGSIRKLAVAAGYSYIYMRMIMCGVSDVNPRIAAFTGYELRWVKKKG